MSRMFGRWADALRAVGNALLEVLAAEAGALQSELAQSGRTLRGGLVLVGLGAAVAFWTVGLGVWVLVEVLTLVLPAYGAALVVFGLGLILCLTLVLIGRRRLRRLESPIHLVKRRGREHAEWWQQTVLPGLGIEVPSPDASDRAEDVAPPESKH